MNALSTTWVGRSRRKLRSSRGENWVEDSWSATTVRPRTSAITVTTVLLMEISSARASSAVPWKASELILQSGGVSIWEIPQPTSSAISAAALGSTQSAPPTYSFRACRRTDHLILRTERWLDVELMVRVRLSPPNLLSHG